jgi:hypothetical protein
MDSTTILPRYEGSCIDDIKWNGIENTNVLKESLYTRVIVWDNIILNHIDITTILPRYEGSCIDDIKWNGIENKNVLKYPS